MEYSKGLYNVISIAHRIYQPFKWIRVWTLTQHPRNLGPLDISLPSLSSLTLEKSIIPSYPLPLPRNSNHTRVNNFEHYPSNPSNSMANGTRPTFRCLTSPTFFFVDLSTITTDRALTTAWSIVRFMACRRIKIRHASRICINEASSDTMIPLRKEFEITTRYQDTYRKSSWKLNEWLQLLIIVEFLIENENFLSRKIFRSLMKKCPRIFVSPPRWNSTDVVHASQRNYQRAVTIIRRI